MAEPSNALQTSKTYQNITKLQERLRSEQSRILGQIDQEERARPQPQRLQELEESVKAAEICEKEHNEKLAAIMSLLDQKALSPDDAEKANEEDKKVCESFAGEKKQLDQLRGQQAQIDQRVRDLRQNERRVAANAALVDNIAQNAQSFSRNESINPDEQMLDTYLIATLCLPENDTSAYEKLTSQTVLQDLSICTDDNLQFAKEKLKHLCIEGEGTCTSQLGKLTPSESQASAATKAAATRMLAQ